MLKIRLQRIGKRGQAYFKLVVLEHTQKPKGRFLEDLGNYDPHKNVINAKKERVEYWMSKGAQLSATANNLLVGREIIKGERVQVWKAKKKKTEEAKPKETTDREGRLSDEQGSGESSGTNPGSTEGSSPNVAVPVIVEAPTA